MKTNWTAPGKGASLYALLDAGNKAFPALCQGPKAGDKKRRTDLAISSNGVWEEADLERIRNVSLYAGGLIS